MTNVPPLLAPVALLADVAEHGLTRGEMGTVVAHLAAGSEKAVLVEFADDEGQTYALIDLKPEQLVLLHRRLCAA
jgi:Domain of unknown function (DUF4926)